ncbi:MAG: hypothetical protein ACHQQS_11380 [Thermoanaerobaculales bacterium]
MRKRMFAVVLSILVAAVVSAETLTVPQVLAAHRAGAPTENIIKLINESEAVAPVSAADVTTLRAAGVPEAVISALMARAPLPAATPAPARPDDPRLVDVVRLVKAGLSESLVAEQVKHSAERYQMTVNDLVYLKENQVPEAIIAALLASTAPPTPTPTPNVPPTPTPIQDLEFKPMLLVTGALRKNSQGAVAVKAERIEWYDEQHPDRNLSLPTSGLQTVWLTCKPRPQGNYCFELGLQVYKGDSYRFRDATWETGSNEKVLGLYDALKARFPKIVYQEKVGN